MKTLFLLLLLSAAFFSSCRRDAGPISQLLLTEAEKAEMNEKMCLTIDGLSDATNAADFTTAGDRAAGAKGKYWPIGKIIKVKFIGGDFLTRAKVMAYAQQWEQYANIDFQQVSSGDSDVRIAFDPDNGNWSAVGTDNQDIPETDITMNLAINLGSSEETIRRAVLHEFGHVLGLKHEHQHPLADINWNVPFVYAYYSQYGWSNDYIDEHVINSLDPADCQYGDYDKYSIMHYYISPALTLDYVGTPWNTFLSEQDKSFIGKVYGTTTISLQHTAWNATKPLKVKLSGITYTMSKGEVLNLYAPPVSAQIYVWETNSNGVWHWQAETYVLPNKSYHVSNDGSPSRFKVMLNN